MNAVEVRDLSKRYRIGGMQELDYKTVRDAFSSLWKRKTATTLPRTFWALRDVSFEVKEGEAIGIIGKNGAGKSTLLKILSRITEPTSGGARLRGRVASLLEVGTGFHPELTGRENIFLNGAILGMTRSEIRKRFDAIVAFAEVSAFLDTPVKRYSSGMHVRLAFAVAAHLDPEIFIVDEVLAVGDAQFQKKCLGTMADAAKGGRTVLFVSHNLAAVQSFCGQAIWLNSGRVTDNGRAATVVSHYLNSNSSELMCRAWDDDTAPGNNDVRLRRAAVVSDTVSGDISIRSPLMLDFEYDVTTPGQNISLSVTLFNHHGTTILASASVTDSTYGQPRPCGRYRTRCEIPGDLLNEGLHSVELYILRDASQVLANVKDALCFEVHDSPEERGGWFGNWPGAVRPRLKWSTESTLIADTLQPINGQVGVSAIDGTLIGSQDTGEGEVPPS